MATGREEFGVSQSALQADNFLTPMGASGKLNASMKFFERLDVYHDFTPRSAAMNMAIDEALLESTAALSIRFYRWKSPALSFGYFGKFADVADYQTERDLVRRWTGGGIVFHGEDLTYSIVLPASDPIFGESSMSIYEKIHRALANALNGLGKRAIVAGGVDSGGIAVATRAAVSASGYSCFANPVQADVMINGRKIAGAAHRRTRAGLLHQGSIQDVDLGNGFAERFACELSQNCKMRTLSDAVQNRAWEIASQKYGTTAWLHKR
jgi:lipoate-protein ligase A